MPSPLTATWSADGISLTATRVEVSLSPSAQQTASFTPLSERTVTCREEVHAHLKAAGGRLLERQEQEEQETDPEQHSELWVWDTTLFLEITYPHFLCDVPIPFQVQGTLHAFVDEGWCEEEMLHPKRCEPHFITYTEKGHVLAYYDSDLTTLDEILASVTWMRRFTQPVEAEDLMRLEKPPAFNIKTGSHLLRPSDNVLLDAYLETLLPGKELAPLWRRLKNTYLGPSAVQELHKHCARDDTLRRTIYKLPEHLLCASRRLYEHWILWINKKTQEAPTFLPDPSLGPMLALPSLLMTACADKHVQAQMEQILDHMTPEELRRWWCTPDTQGKTGAQWFLFGILGDGGLVRTWSKSLLKEKDVSDQEISLPSSDITYDRVQWGKGLLQRIENVIGPQEDAWISEQWSPAGLCVEALCASTTSGSIVYHTLECLALLPETVWRHPARCFTSQPFFQETAQSDAQFFQNPTRDVSLVQCALSFILEATPARVTELLMPGLQGTASDAWRSVLATLSFRDFKDGYTCDGPFPELKVTTEHQKVLERLLEEGRRLSTHAALTHALKASSTQEGAGKARRRM